MEPQETNKATKTATEIAHQQASFRDTEFIKWAYQFAEEKHAGQLDDSGKNYFQAHLNPVSMILARICPDDANLIAAGLLHDTIEDTSTTYEDLAKNFSIDVADLVMEVTKVDTDHGSVFPRLKTKRGIMLKFADRLSNLSRMESWPDDRQEHYLKRSKFWKSE